MTVSELSKTRLALGMLVTAIVALSIHVVMLQVWHAAYPAAPPRAPFAQYVSRGVLHVLGLIWLNMLLERTHDGRSWLRRSTLLFVLTAMLTESLIRAPFMQGYCTNSFAFAFLSTVPKWAAAWLLAALVVFAGRWVTTATRVVGVAAVLGAIHMYILIPACAAAFAGVLDAAQFLSHPEWCELPYGLNVEVPAYLSFIEPVAAAFSIAALCWTRLPGPLVRRLCGFVLLVLLLRRQLLAAPIYMLWSDLPPLQGLAAMGQFSLEALALGALTGLFWEWARAG